MVIKIFDINSYSPTRSDKFFFDNNIWIYLFYPMGNHNKTVIKSYERFFGKILKAEAKIFISSLILSEFFNTCARTEFMIKSKKSPDKYKSFKKDFRNSDEYQDLMGDLKKIVKKGMMSVSEPIDDGFRSIDIDALFEKLEDNDFNDKYVAQLAMKNELKIVTNDIDFQTIDLPFELFTANKKLLSLTQSYN